MRSRPLYRPKEVSHAHRAGKVFQVITSILDCFLNQYMSRDLRLIDARNHFAKLTCKRHSAVYSGAHFGSQDQGCIGRTPVQGRA